MIVGGFFRFYHLDQPQRPLWDEHHYVLPAKVVVGLVDNPGVPPKWKLFGHDLIAKSPEPNFSHPILGKVLIGMGMRVFGDNSFGWRVGSATLGTLSILALFLLAMALTQSFWFAAGAAAFLSIETLHISLSRVAMLDAPLFFFMIVNLYGWVKLIRTREKWHWPLITLTALSAFATVSIKYNGALLVIFGLMAYLYAKSRRQNQLTSSLQVSSAISFMAVTFYGVWYFIYFREAFSPVEWLQFHYDTMKATLNITSDHAFGSAPWMWVLNQKPIIYMQGAGIQSYAMIGFVNPVLLALFLPALALVSYRAVIQKIPADMVMMCLVLVLYGSLFVLLKNRSQSAFMHHFLPTMMPLCLVVARFFHVGLRQHVRFRAMAMAVLFCGAAAYTPLSMAWPIHERIFTFLHATVVNEPLRRMLF